jgi:crossover junction endodeoxyribonuclease RuvC
MRPSQTATKIILGIDPGTVVMGHGVISVSGAKIELLEMGVLKLGTTDDPYIRLQKIYQRILSLIESYQPGHFAIEAPFFGKNVQSMLKLGRAQGVAIAAAIQCGLSVTEYSPKKVKQSITGNGNASKEQVLKMLQQIIGFKESPRFLDATDALSVAVCHSFQDKKPLATTKKTKKTVSKWEDFVTANPRRIIR